MFRVADTSGRYPASQPRRDRHPIRHAHAGRRHCPLEVAPFNAFRYVQSRRWFGLSCRHDHKPVDPADGPSSYTIEGDIVEYKKGSVAKEVLIGFGAGFRALRAHVVIRRMSDNQAIFDQVAPILGALLIERGLVPGDPG